MRDCLLALTRPARSGDLSKLDIFACSFTEVGIIFKAQHLSKQSRPLKPLADLDTQRIRLFAQWQHCMLAYEARTRGFRT